MKAIAVKPGVKNSVHLVEMPQPSLAEIPNGRGVLVKVLRVGVDGTDKEINNAEYGAPPDGAELHFGWNSGHRGCNKRASADHGAQWIVSAARKDDE